MKRKMKPSPKVFSLTSLSWLLTASALPVSAQVAPTTTHTTPVHFMPNTHQSSIQNHNSLLQNTHVASLHAQTVASPGHHIIWQNLNQVSATTTSSTSTPSKIVSLDLSSATQSASLGHQLSTMSVTITVGGSALNVTSGTHLTAAEKVAALQVLSSGSQTLFLKQ